MNEIELIKIASDTNYYGLKKDCIKTAKVKNRICGDEIIIGINQEKSQIYYETNACVLTQATAAILANNFQNLDKNNFKEYINKIKNFYKEKVELPNELDTINKILFGSNKNRKECVMLPFNAIEKIIND